MIQLTAKKEIPAGEWAPSTTPAVDLLLYGNLLYCKEEDRWLKPMQHPTYTHSNISRAVFRLGRGVGKCNFNYRRAIQLLHNFSDSLPDLLNYKPKPSVKEKLMDRTDRTVLVDSPFFKTNKLNYARRKRNNDNQGRQGGRHSHTIR